MDARLNELQKSLESAVKGMSSEQLGWHPPGKWCATQVLEHLFLTYTGTIKGFERVMTAGKPLATRASMTHRVRTLVTVSLGHMTTGRQAPSITVPKGLPPEKVREELGAKLAAMDAIIAQCEERFGGRIKVLDHPILGPLTAPQWRKLHVVHGWHHQRQLLQLRASATKHAG